MRYHEVIYSRMSPKSLISDVSRSTYTEKNPDNALPLSLKTLPINHLRVYYDVINPLRIHQSKGL